MTLSMLAFVTLALVVLVTSLFAILERVEDERIPSNQAAFRSGEGRASSRAPLPASAIAPAHRSSSRRIA